MTAFEKKQIGNYQNGDRHEVGGSGTEGGPQRMFLPRSVRFGRKVFGSGHRKGGGDTCDAARKRHEPRFVQRKREPGQRPREFDQSVVQAQYHRTHIGQPHSAGQVGQILPVALFLRSDPNELLPLGIQGITRLRAFFHTAPSAGRQKPAPAPALSTHTRKPVSDRGAISRPVLRFRIAQCRLSSCMIRTRVCRRTGSFFQFGQPAVDFAQGGLLPLKVQKVFAVASIFAWLFRPKPPAPGVADVTIPNPQKICRNSARTTAGRRFYPGGRGRKKSIPALLRVLQEYPSSRFSNPSKSIFHGINDARNCTVKGAGQQIRAHTLI